jgi:hypothetical protein
MLWDALIGRRGVSAIHRLTLAGSALMLAARTFEDLAAPPIEGASDDASGIAVLLRWPGRCRPSRFSTPKWCCFSPARRRPFSGGVQACIDRYAPPRDFSTFIAFDALGAGDPGWAAQQGLSAFSAVHAAPRITALARGHRPPPPGAALQRPFGEYAHAGGAAAAPRVRGAVPDRRRQRRRPARPRASPSRRAQLQRRGHARRAPHSSGCALRARWMRRPDAAEANGLLCT